MMLIMLAHIFPEQHGESFENQVSKAPKHRKRVGPSL